MLSFSIVIPNLNQSRFLATAFGSLRYQSAPFQIALMDGGSTDGFNSEIKQYSDMITYVKSTPDKGQAFAIQEGTEKISGDIIAWLNADDYYFPGILDRVAKYFDESPELDVIYGDAIHVTPEGFFLSYFPKIKEFDSMTLMRSCFICQPSCFVRREAYEKVGGVNSDLQYTMDWDLWCRLSLAGARFSYANRLFSAVRYYAETKTLRGDFVRYREIWDIERKYGRRLFPLSWLGTYHYSLKFREKKSIWETFLFHFLGLLKAVKEWASLIISLKNDLGIPNFGFKKRGDIVKGSCEIHIPYYGKRPWKNIYLSLWPIDRKYIISINGDSFPNKLNSQGELVVAIPLIDGPYRKIVIEHTENKTWTFKALTWDFLGSENS